MDFFKKNFHDILRLYINQVGITIFALMLYTAAGIPDDGVLVSKLRTVVSVFSLLFYFILLYYVVWEYGAKDKIRVDGGRQAPIALKGLFMSLIANIPNFVLGTLSVAFCIICLLGADGMLNVFGIIFPITMVHASMYMGVIQTIVYGFNLPDPEMLNLTEYVIMSVLFTLLPMFSCCVTQFAYYLGSHEKKLLNIFSSKNK